MAEDTTNSPVDEDAAADEAALSGPSQSAPGGPGAAGPEAVTAPARPGSSAGRWIAATVLAAVIIGGAGALLVWWQYRQSLDGLGAENAFVQQSLDQAHEAVAAMQLQVRALEDELGASRAEVAGLRSDLESLPAELRALRRQVEALQGGQVDSRESWLEQQARYYLVLANTELALGGRIASAMAALELADGVLSEVGDPGLADVRRAIAAELQSLRSVERPDLERQLAELAALIGRVPELPMRAAAPQNFSAAEESLDDMEPGLGRLWEQTKGAVTSIVRVERQEEPVAVLLTESERRLARRQLALELQIARTALFERRQQSFRASLVAADGILNRDFDREVQAIVEARRLLAGMMRIEVEPELPDIGDSLSLLRTALGAE